MKSVNKSSTNGKLERLAEKHGSECIPADEYFNAIWTPEHERLEQKANALFAELNDGTRDEDGVWKEVWQRMEADERKMEEGLNAKSGIGKQRHHQ